MPLHKLPFKSLGELLKMRLTSEEDPKTAKLIKDFSKTKARGWLTKRELEKICRWKSHRAIVLVKSNPPRLIKLITKEAFKSRNEKNKVELLIKLRGVSIPMASSILMLKNPKRYGVIDIRVWEILYKLGTVTTNPKGVNFKINEWYRLQMILRYFAKKYVVTVRAIEYSIFIVHQEFQKGKLYRA